MAETIHIVRIHIGPRILNGIDNKRFASKLEHVGSHFTAHALSEIGNNANHIADLKGTARSMEKLIALVVLNIAFLHVGNDLGIFVVKSEIVPSAFQRFLDRMGFAVLDKVIDKLKGGDERAVLKGATEKTELDGVAVGEIESEVAVIVRITAGTGDLLDGLLFRIIGADADIHLLAPAELVVIAAAELDHGIPEAFHDQSDLGDGSFLSIGGGAKTGAVDMDMQTTGASLVRGELVLKRGFADLLPREFLHVVIQGAGMSDDLKAIIQTAITLGVEKIFIAADNVLGTGSRIIAVVNFVFNSHVNEIRAISERIIRSGVENGSRLIGIIVNAASAIIPAGRAVIFILAFIVITVIYMEHISALVAAAIGLSAIIAKGMAVIIVETETIIAEILAALLAPGIITQAGITNGEIRIRPSMLTMNKGAFAVQNERTAIVTGFNVFIAFAADPGAGLIHVEVASVVISTAVITEETFALYVQIFIGAFTGNFHADQTTIKIAGGIIAFTDDGLVEIGFVSPFPFDIDCGIGALEDLAGEFQSFGEIGVKTVEHRDQLIERLLAFLGDTGVQTAILNALIHDVRLHLHGGIALGISGGGNLIEMVRHVTVPLSFDFISYLIRLKNGYKKETIQDTRSERRGLCYRWLC